MMFPFPCCRMSSVLAKRVCKILEEWDVDEQELLAAVKDRMDDVRAMPTEAEKKKAAAEIARCERYIGDWVKKYEAAVFNDQVLTAPENEQYYAPYKPKEVARAVGVRGGRRGVAAAPAARAAAAPAPVVDLDDEEMALALEILRQRKARAAAKAREEAKEEEEEAKEVMNDDEEGEEGAPEGEADAAEVAAVDNLMAAAALDDAAKNKRRGGRKQ